tara:strand:- start:62 stop:967 length:906 start_codon:yes stop_codon:yes gene_type:complete
MVEPERVLHSVMVIAFERKGVIDQDLKIIKAVQGELNLDDEDKFDALEHIKKFRGNGDWSGKRDAVVSVAIERIEEAIEDNLIENSSITNALTKLINVTLNEQKPANNPPSNDPLAAFEEEEEEMADTSLKFGLEEEEEEEIVPVELIETEDGVEEFENDSIVSQDAFSLGGSENDIEEVDDEDVDPFDLIGGRENTNSGNGRSEYRDPLDELMDEVDDEELQVETIELGSDDSEESETEPEKETIASESQIIEMYRMMLDTVWVDDIIDPSEVALLARKRKELDISFETHMELVREMLED